MDDIDMINPKARNVHQFILVAIDYFSKWVETALYANLTEVQVAYLSKVNKNDLLIWLAQKFQHPIDQR